MILCLQTFKKKQYLKLMYVWGHSYELDYNESRWEGFENLCKMISGKEDIFYGTNKEVLL